METPSKNGNKDYELTVLYIPDLSDAEVEKSVERLKSTVSRLGGEVRKTENEGKKRLAYTIRNQEFAIYVFFTLTLPNKAVKPCRNAATELADWLNLEDNILRHLLVMASSKADE